VYNIRFPGQVFDGQAGLHQNGHRDFDPAIGGYVESDPLGLSGGTNPYTYVRAMPTRAFAYSSTSFVMHSASRLLHNAVT